MGIRTELLAAWRRARREPLPSLALIVVLAVGIAAATLVLGAADAALVRPLPFAAPDRLVLLWERMPNGEPMYLSPPNFADWRERLRQVEGIAAFDQRDVVVGDAPPQVLLAARVSGGLFPTLGVAPLLGRALTPADDAPGAAPAVVLAERTWRSRFAGDSAAIGRRVPIDGVPTEIVGVMSATFAFPPALQIEGIDSARAAELWLPLRLDYAADQRGAHYLCALGRLADGAGVESAGAELATLTAEIARRHADTQSGWSGSVASLGEQAARPVRPALLALVGAVAALLALSGANAAQLVLAGGVARRRELAVRAALGASPLRLTRSLVAEQLVVTAVAGAAGLGLVAVGLPLLRALAPAEAPWIAELTIDLRVLLLGFAAALAVGAASALLPLVAWRRQAAASALRARGAGGEREATRLRRLLIAGQIALVVPLLVVGALLVKSFARLAAVDAGFRAEGALVARLALPAAQFPDRAARQLALAAVEERLRGLPGVDAVGAITGAPILVEREGTTFELPGIDLPVDVRPETAFAEVTPGYFAAAGVELVAGRVFAAGDDGGAGRTAIVNRAFVRRYLGGREALGREVVVGMDGASRRIVGVVGNERHDSLARAAEANVYVPYLETGRWSRVVLVLRTADDLGALARALPAAVGEAAPAAAVFAVQPYTSIVSRSLGRPRFAATLLVAFAALGALLAAFGLYAVVRHAVASRRAEMAVRSALGARAADLAGLVVGEAGRLTAVGLVAGLALGAAGARLARGLLFGVSEFDPAAFALPLVVLAAIVLGATLGPALAAGRVPPVEALRGE